MDYLTNQELARLGQSQEREGDRAGVEFFSFCREDLQT